MSKKHCVTFNVAIGFVDVKKIRESLCMSQSEFAIFMNVAVDTLQNWEQGRRVPDSSTSILLRMYRDDPESTIRLVFSIGKEEILERLSEDGLYRWFKKVLAKNLHLVEIPDFQLSIK